MTVTTQPLLEPWISVGVRGIDNQYTPPSNCFQITKDRETRRCITRRFIRMSGQLTASKRASVL